MKPNIVKMVVSLGIIAIVSGALMAWVNELTAPEIAQAESRERVAAVGAVTDSEFDNNPIDDAWAAQTGADEAQPVIVYPLILKGRFTGAAIESYSLNGFDGTVRVMYGFDPEGTVTGFTVLKQTETPGLGAKMEQWFRDPTGRRSVIGLNPTSAPLTVAKDGGTVDGITAATISSRAFLDALNRASDAFTAYKAEKK